MTDIKERPILFNAAMVNAILDGRKTQTRRLAKPRKHPSLLAGNWSDAYVLDGGNHDWLMQDNIYGQPGDQLWVRETFSIVPRTAYRMSEGVEQIEKPTCNHDAAIYRAGWDRSAGGLRWQPSIHMPRWASRIQLEVTALRIERLQNITIADALAEGINHKTMACPRHEYFQLWNSINGDMNHEQNPWVWVIEFKRIEK